MASCLGSAAGKMDFSLRAALSLLGSSRARTSGD